MARDHLEGFLANSEIASKATVPARVVFRSRQRSPAEMRTALASGNLTFRGEAMCDLVAGGQTIARGEIVEKDGSWFFVAKERAE